MSATASESRAKAYEALAARYPDDDEAQIFYALYLAGTQSQAEQTYATYLKSAAILEKQFIKYPDHPGVAHYLIHSYDAPPIAQKGLPAARRYASIAPAAPHALHMPSHIFTRVGAWEDSAATNRALGGRGQDRATTRTSKCMRWTTWSMPTCSSRVTMMRALLWRKPPGYPASFVTPGPTRSPRSRRAMRLSAVTGVAAMKLQPIANDFHYTEALTRFARALGAARSGDSASAEKEVGHLARLRDALKAAKNEYWATEVEVSRLAASAWTALALGKKDEALKLMRSAADMEDKNEKHIVTPGRIVPARELLGQMLLGTQAACRGAQRVRGVADPRAKPFPRICRCRAGGGAKRKLRQGQAALYPTHRTRWQRRAATGTRAGKDVPGAAMSRTTWSVPAWEMESNDFAAASDCRACRRNRAWHGLALLCRTLRKLLLKFRRRTLITLAAGKPLRQKTGPPLLSHFRRPQSATPVMLTSRITSDTLTAKQESSISHSRTIIKLSR